MYAAVSDKQSLISIRKYICQLFCTTICSEIEIRDKHIFIRINPTVLEIKNAADLRFSRLIYTIAVCQILIKQYFMQCGLLVEIKNSIIVSYVLLL